MKPGIKIGERSLDHGCNPYIIAEIGVNHNGDWDIACATIDAAVHAGVDAVKFQTFRTEEFMADPDHIYEYESEGRIMRESMYEMFKRLELPESWHARLKQYCDLKGIDFLSSAADPLSADLLAELHVPAIKVASEDLVNHPLLRHVAQLGMPVILSTGMGNESEIDRAIQVLQAGGCTDILPLHCVSLYPTPDNEVNLNRMISLQERYNVPVGYSDHSRGITASLGAVALGAVLIEKHFTLDRYLPGPDHAFSSDPAEMTELVASARRLHLQLGCADLRPSPGEEAARLSFRRSIVARRDLKAGTVLTRELLHLKRPGTGISPMELDKVVGRRLLVDLKVDQKIEQKFIE